MRTTSSLECLNSVIQKTFPSRPTIFRFIECLKLHEASKAVELYQISKGEINTPKLQRRRKLDREREEKIRFLTTQLNNDKICVADFLVAMSEKDVLPPDGTHSAFHIQIQHFF